MPRLWQGGQGGRVEVEGDAAQPGHLQSLGRRTAVKVIFSSSLAAWRNTEHVV